MNQIELFSDSSEFRPSFFVHRSSSRFSSRIPVHRIPSYTSRSGPYHIPMTGIKASLPLFEAGSMLPKHRVYFFQCLRSASYRKKVFFLLSTPFVRRECACFRQHFNLCKQFVLSRNRRHDPQQFGLSGNTISAIQQSFGKIVFDRLICGLDCFSFIENRSYSIRYGRSGSAFSDPLIDWSGNLSFNYVDKITKAGNSLSHFRNMAIQRTDDFSHSGFARACDGGREQRSNENDCPHCTSLPLRQ